MHGHRFHQSEVYELADLPVSTSAKPIVVKPAGQSAPFHTGFCVHRVAQFAYLHSELGLTGMRAADTQRPADVS